SSRSWTEARARKVGIRQCNGKSGRVRDPPRAMGTAGGLCRQVLADTAFAKLVEPRSSTLPLLPHHRPKSAAQPRFEALQHRGRLTITKVPEPPSQVGRDLFDHQR